MGCLKNWKSILFTGVSTDDADYAFSSCVTRLRNQVITRGLQPGSDFMCMAENKQTEVVPTT